MTERREPNTGIDRRVDRLDAKIDAVGVQVERVGSETKSALEMLMKQQDERWKWFEQRSDMEARNQKQAIELLTSSMVKVQQDVASTDTQLDLIERDHQVGQAKLNEQKINADIIHAEHLRRIEAIDGNLKWIARTLAATVLTGVAGIMFAAITDHL